MSGARGGRRRGGGRSGGRGGGGGHCNINMTQAELNNLLQQQVNMALAAFPAGHNVLGGKLIPINSALFLGVMSFLLWFIRASCLRCCC